MDLDVYKLEMKRERLAERILAIAKQWSAILQELERFVAPSGARIAAVSESPLADPRALSTAHMQLADGTEWLPLATVMAQLRGNAAELATEAVPTVENKSDEVAQNLEQLTLQVDELNSMRIQLHSMQQLKLADIQSLARRISTLNDDLLKNLDVQRLQRYSGATAGLTPNRCPTCEQSLVDTLLSQKFSFFNYADF